MREVLKFVAVLALGLALASAAMATTADSRGSATGEEAVQRPILSNGGDVPIVLQDPAIANHDIGNVLYTVSNFGQYGLAPTDLNPDWSGVGFKYPQAGANLLFEGALLIGDGPTRVSNGARDENQILCDHFVSTADIELYEPGPFAEQEYHTAFDDSNAPIPLEIEVSQETYAFSSDPDDDYVITEYTITNIGDEPLEGVLVAHFEDWDMPWNVATDRVDFDRSRNLGYQYDSNDNYRGQQVLSDMGVYSFRALDNEIDVFPPRFTMEDKWNYMNAGIVDTAITTVRDCSMMITTGPYDIAPGESVVATFAIIGGDGLSDLQANADAAIAAYQEPVEEIVYFEDFDSGMGIWGGEWGLATNNYHSEPNSLADSPVGNYANYDTVVVETTEDIDLVGYAGYRLEFWTKYDIETGFDYVYLDISSDGGTNWNNLEVFNGEGIDWYNYVADLGGYAQRSIRFRFTLETDALYTVDGMYVDDFTIFGLDTDTSPPLILHDGPTPATSVPEDFTVLATITDYSGVETAWVSYAVDGSDLEIAEIDSTVGDDYYFTIPAVEAGAHVEYFITAVDNADNEGSTATQHYVSGSVILYDDGEPEYIYQYAAGNKLAVRFTPEENCVLVTGLMRLYTDNASPPHPLDTVDVEVWNNGSGNLPGQSALEPFGVWPASTLDNPQAWTYVDFRDMGLEFDDDFHFGFTYRSEFPVILGEDPVVGMRSSVYSGGFWSLEASTDFEMRVVVDYGVTGVEDGENQTPTKFALKQNYPNPFNASTVLNFSLVQSGHVKLNVYNVLGQHVETLVDGDYEAGQYSVSWDAGDLPSGAYFARLETGEETANIKMMLLK
jgi:hypothetical protein